MTIPDSGDPGNIHDAMGIGPQKPDLLDDATWQHIHQRFQLRGEKGRGGQAVVFEAKELAAPHRRVALKVYHENSDAARKAFENECRILASDHLPPGVVSYYECSAERGLQPYLVLEFIDATKLGELAAHGNLNLDRKLDLIERLAQSFHRLHQSNLVFGDASANNILIEKGFVVRFVDLAGAKELMRGHGRSRSSVNLVTPGFVPQTEADTAALKVVRTSLNTDIYALAANAFLLLTGRTEIDCRRGGSRSGDADWNRALTEAGVPSGLSRVILRGLRVADETLANDPRLYPTAEAFAKDVAAWRSHRRQRRTVLVWGVPVAFCFAVLAIVASVGWSKYETERMASEFRRFESLHERVTKLPNVGQPALQALLVDVDALRQQREEQLSKQQTATAASTLRQMNRKLEQAIDTSAALEPCLELREVLATELVADSADAIIPWLTECPHVLLGWKRLVQRNGEIKQQLEAGQTAAAYQGLVVLQKEILKLKWDNDRAVSAREKQRRYDAVQSSVAERLRKLPEFDTIDSLARGGREDWKLGSFDGAERNLGQALQRLNDWLEKNEAADERAIRVAQLQAIHQAELREEVQRLTSQRDTARNERDGLQTSVTLLNVQLQATIAEAATHKSKADNLAKEKTKLDEHVAALTMDKAVLNDRLKTEVEARRTQLAEAERWKNMANANPTTVRETPSLGIKAGNRSVIQIDRVEYPFRWCPPGKFKIGTPSTEIGHEIEEAQVDVTLSRGFWILETEVTQEMYIAIMQSRPWKEELRCKEGPNYPASYVEWDDARRFCDKLTAAGHNAGVLPVTERIVLPSEAQWEYAARGGTTTSYFFGDDELKLGEYAWYEKNAWDIGEKYAHPVGQKNANPWGLLDITGNVMEWCSDFHPGLPTGYGARGGSFMDSTSSCRIGNRLMRLSSLVCGTGIRVVRVLE